MTMIKNDLMKRISDSWDSNVSIRALDLESKSDFTYTTIIEPYVMNCLENIINDNTKILDIGCGCGYLTKNIYDLYDCDITGMDLSEKSIEYAATKYPEIKFVKNDFLTYKNKNKYDICLAVMTINNLPSIDEFFKSVDKCLYPNGYLLITVPHPYYWTLRHINNKEFLYNKNDVGYQIQFKTKGHKDYKSPILYFHRSKEKYLECIEKYHYEIIKFDELSECENDTTPDILAFLLKKTGN